MVVLKFHCHFPPFSNDWFKVYILVYSTLSKWRGWSRREENICPIFGVIIQDNYLNLDRLQYIM
jgi:hypothetical protein